MNMKGLLQRRARYLQNIGGPWNLTEFDRMPNKISRAIVRAMREEHGEAWLVKINPDGDQRAIWQYNYGVVHNFEADIVLPAYDIDLAIALWGYNGAPTISRINAIFDRAEVLGGICLIWV